MLLAEESLLKGLSVVESDKAGHLVRRLKAVSAVGSFAEPKLLDGKVEFFDVRNTESVPVGVLSFAEALYRRTRSEIEGTGRISYRSAQGMLQGDGFHYRMAEHRLVLKSNVVLEMSAGRAISKAGDALLRSDEKGSGVSGLVQARMTGGVILMRTPDAKYPFDRAETASAVYTAADGMLTLASPVTMWSGEKKSEASAEEIRLFVGFLREQVPVGDAR